MPADTEIDIPVTTASSGRVKVVPSTAIDADGLVKRFIETCVLLTVLRIFAGLLHCGEEEASLPAAVGVWVALVLEPDVVEAYEVLPRIPFVFVHVLPLVTTTVAILGMFGPTKFPTVELAIPDNPVNVPKTILPTGTTAVKVFSTVSTVSTKTVSPLRKESCPTKLLSTKPSFTEGSLPV